MNETPIKVLQIGSSDWSVQYTIPEQMEWTFAREGQFEQVLVDEKGKKVKAFDLLIFTDTDYEKESFERLIPFATPYSVFYNVLVRNKDAFSKLFLSKQAQAIAMDNPQDLIEDFSKTFFVGQEGSKLDPRFLDVFDSFKGKISYKGNAFTVFEGDFGQELTPLLTWRYNMISRINQDLDIWLEYIKDQELAIDLTAFQFASGTSDIIRKLSFTEVDLENQITIPSLEKESYVSFTLKVKGQGRLKLGPLHQRRSRLGRGQFIAGGKRLVDDNRQELIAYFSPGDLKPPLNVYFSGYRTAEGFEGYWMMTNMKAPFVLIGDPRLEGGSFYLGSDALESQVTAFIEEKLDFLGFKKDQLILSGLSMGTFGASYYATQLHPHAVIIGKPLFSLGNIAKNGYQMRPDEFGTAFDMVYGLTNQLSQNSMDQVNHRFWNAVDQSDLSKTLFAMAYMKHDDYDRTAYYDFLERTKGKNIKVISKGIEGRHNDNSGSINQWFLNQYKRIMSLDFGRES